MRRRLIARYWANSTEQGMRCTHFVGFRDDRYWNAVAVWGRPHFIHRWWDKRARREISAEDVVVFADGDWTQEPKKFNAPDFDEA